MRNTNKKKAAIDKWDIGWRTVGKPQIAPSAEQGAVATEELPAEQQLLGGVMVKSVAIPQKPKVPKSAPVAIKGVPKQPTRPAPVEEIRQDKSKASPTEPQASQDEAESAKGWRDLQSGMELLGIEFMLDLAEKTDFDTRDEAVMHNLGLNELIRRGNLDQIDSRTLATYANNDGNFYSTQVQCSAMQILAQRTVGDN